MAEKPVVVDTERISASLFCPITITTQPVSQTDCEDNGVEFMAAFNAGGASVNYQWEISTDGGSSWSPIGAFPNISGASGTGLVTTATLTVGNVGVGGANGANTSGVRY